MNPKHSRRFYIKTFGCQMNDYDSARAAALLESLHYERADSPADADLVLLTTCTVRQKAADKIYSALGRLNKLKRRNPRLLIGVGGCLAQHEPDRLLKQFPCIDLLYGTGALARLGELVQAAAEGKRPVDIGADAGHAMYAHMPRPSFGRSRSCAFVTVMQGCDNYCTYCIVPYVRGPEWSRTPGDILDEARQLISAGVRDITLLGQNVNSYGKTLAAHCSFAALLSRLNELPGLERLRFITSHPKDLTDELIACFGALDKLCEHIHLPLQSGSDRILSAMNRRYSAARYEELIGKLRTARPDISITSDIIVGFPGETDDDFNLTRDLIGRIGFDDLFIFHYTDREGTRACALPEKVPYSLKIERLRELNRLQRVVSRQRNVALIGATLDVLFEGPSSRGSGCSAGRTRSNRVVNCPAPVEMEGRTAAVTIRAAGVHSLSGTLA